MKCSGLKHIPGTTSLWERVQTFWTIENVMGSALGNGGRVWRAAILISFSFSLSECFQPRLSLANELSVCSILHRFSSLIRIVSHDSVSHIFSHFTLYVW